MRVIAAATIVAAALVAVATAPAEDPLTVYAAASLRQAFPDYDSAPRYSFAGSGMVQLQVERGAPADVFASASPEEAQALYRQGRCTRPQTFATNRLALLVPEGNPGRVRNVFALVRGRRRLAIAGPGVPVGDYARALLARVGASSILRANTVSEESSVAGITTKVATRSADAGLAYATDGRAAAGRVDVVALPGGAQPPIRLQVCAVRRRGADVARARRWIAGLRGGNGRAALRRHGFGL